MEEEYRIVNGFKLPPKRHTVVKRQASSSSATTGQQIQATHTFTPSGKKSSDSHSGTDVRTESSSPMIDTLSSYENDPHYEKNPSWNSLRPWRGRMKRGEYLLFCLLLFPLSILGAIIASFGIMMINGVVGTAILIASILWLVLILYSAVVRRFHDFGLSGWWVLVFDLGQVACVWGILAILITVKGTWTLDGVFDVIGKTRWLEVLIYIVNLAVVLWPGTKGPNKFGPDPR